MSPMPQIAKLPINRIMTAAMTILPSQFSEAVRIPRSMDDHSLVGLCAFCARRALDQGHGNNIYRTQQPQLMGRAEDTTPQVLEFRRLRPFSPDIPSGTARWSQGMERSWRAKRVGHWSWATGR